MAFTSGFFNAVKSDRTYNAEQMGELFDGILKDGIIPSQGKLFAVTAAGSGLRINVDTGRAWFDHTWSKNDSIMVLTVEQPDATRDRIDAVVLEVNHTNEIRANSIKIIKGVASQNPDKPVLLYNDEVKQYPLAYVTVKAGATIIVASNIESMIGRSPTVFATGVLESVSLDQLWAQWKGDWETWFAGIKLQLTEDVVTNLQYQIEQLNTKVSTIEARVKDVTHTVIFTESGVFHNPYKSTLNVIIREFGGGGGYGTKGGGGGYMTLTTQSIPADVYVPVTIGDAGALGSNGGTTSFGTYASATGGASNGAGGSGGGGEGGTSNNKNGGTASYGGGGGGGGGYIDHNGDNSVASGIGGSGGTYGGGGGGGGGALFSNTIGNAGGVGGTKGTNGGAGGAGGAGNQSGNTIATSASPGSNGSSGINTNSMNLEFKGSGNGGSGGGVGNPNYPSDPTASGGGGGGGGGYGGTGGIGGHGAQYVGTGRNGYNGAGGGGGGGYGASGGAGTGGGVISNGYGNGQAGGGGGGGGYGGAGGAGSYSGQGYGAGGSNGSVGNYNSSIYGGGGGGYGLYPPSEIYGGAHRGVCIITYTIKEIVYQ